MPALLLAPFLTFVIVVAGVRGRRATSNVTGFGALVTAAVVGLVTWARWKHGEPLTTTYQWINVPTSFTGAQAFQGFGIDISLRVDHLALAAEAALAMVTFAVIVWQRGGSRQEPGPARLHALFALGLLGSAGVVLSGDLAALLAWWGLAGVATYLLLAHRWGTEAAGRASRLGLALPYIGDLALLSGVAVIYSRYGQLTLDKLTYTFLRSGYDTGLKGLGLAAVLIGLAAIVRGGLFPFTGWLTGTLEAPPAAVAWTQGVWSLLSVVLVVRVLPLYIASGPQPFRLLAYACGLGVVAGAVLSLVDNHLRRSFTWAGSAVVALLLLGVGQPNALAPAVAGALVVALARPATALAASSIAAAMRSFDIADMGETWRRMRLTSLALAGGALALALAAAPKFAARASWQSAWFAAAALVVVGAALLRPYVAVAHLELRRRRAFEPTRVREVLPAAAYSALGLALLGVAGVVLAGIAPWLSFLGGHTQPAVSVTTLLLWLGFGLGGALIGAAAVLAGGRRAVDLAGRAQGAIAGWFGVGVYATDRFLRRAGIGAIDAVEGRVIDGGEGALGSALARVGGLELGWGMAIGGAALGIVIGLLVAVAVLGGLLAPGVVR